ncbi:MAG TPA: tetratricopeptide repeat protein [Pyrinomonadaceae bacterium]|jgi:tetratricopeptide (TPR) repeat protein|nr:tetratricopeptide repeat protein [Pyrinomonadaceae bacterium]
MTRENILFGVVGLLLGYVIAFHLVVYVNHSRPDAAGGALPDGHPELAGGAGAGNEAQRLKSAADAAARAAEESPKDFDAQLKAAMAFMDAGGFDEASAFLARANALRPDDLDVRSELAVTYFMRTPPQKEKAITELRRNLETDPSHLPSLHNLTRMLLETKRLDEAEATLEKLEKAKPDYEQLPQLRSEVEGARRAAKSSDPSGKGAKKSPTD